MGGRKREDRAVDGSLAKLASVGWWELSLKHSPGQRKKHDSKFKVWVKLRTTAYV